MNPLDAALLVTAALAATLGWRLGLVSTVASLLAVAVGGSLGFLLGRRVTEAVGMPRENAAVVLMTVMVVGILLGQAVAARPLRRLHDRVSGSGLRHVNSAGGAAMSVGFAVAVVWMLATALTLASSTQLASLMRGSTLLVRFDASVPADAGALFRQFETSAGLSQQGRIFTGLGLLPVPGLPLPTQPASPTMQAAAESSVVRIMGSAECGIGIAGSGVAVGDGLVLTNAHVVAGVRHPLVYPDDRSVGLTAIPVWFDPMRDAALLRVPGLDVPAVDVADDPVQGEVVAVAGYPNAGPLDVKPARVRGTVRASSSDIYGAGQAQRSVLVIAGEVIPGDSGGPLLDEDGRIAGLVFAASLEPGGHTGYALTASEVSQALGGAVTDAAVSTGGCATVD
jgi:S1-C subfamily serine protease